MLPTKEEYIKQIFSETIMKSKPLYKCPKCGGDVRRNDATVLLSYPPKHRYECDNCEYSEVF